MIPNLDEAPYSEGLRRLLYDAVARIVLTPDSGEPGLIRFPHAGAEAGAHAGAEAGNLAVFYAWGRWFAVWRDFGEDCCELPVSRVWQVVRLSADPSTPDEVLLHEV